MKRQNTIGIGHRKKHLTVKYWTRIQGIRLIWLNGLPRWCWRINSPYRIYTPSPSPLYQYMKIVNFYASVFNLFRLTKSRAKSLQATFCKPEIVDSLVMLSTHSYLELHCFIYINIILKAKNSKLLWKRSEDMCKEDKRAGNPETNTI